MIVSSSVVKVLTQVRISSVFSPVTAFMRFFPPEILHVQVLHVPDRHDAEMAILFDSNASRTDCQSRGTWIVFVSPSASVKIIEAKLVATRFFGNHSNIFKMTKRKKRMTY